MAQKIAGPSMAELLPGVFGEFPPLAGGDIEAQFLNRTCRGD